MKIYNVNFTYKKRNSDGSKTFETIMQANSLVECQNLVKENLGIKEGDLIWSVCRTEENFVQ